MTRRAALSAIAGALATAAAPLDAAPRKLTWEQFLEHAKADTLRHGDHTRFIADVNVTCVGFGETLPLRVESILRAEYNSETHKWELVEESIDAHKRT